MALLIQTLVVSPLMQNCSLLACGETKEALLIDPGDDAGLILRAVDQSGLQVKYMLATHGHVDHISAVAELQRRRGWPFYIHEKEKTTLEMLTASQAFYGFGDGKQPQVDAWLNPQERYHLGRLRFSVIETPGHTPGGVCFDFGEHLFVGDTLFQGSIGRTDLPGGDYATLIRSIKTKLWPLDDELTVYSGHGPTTTLGVEKQTNPFLLAC